MARRRDSLSCSPPHCRQWQCALLLTVLAQLSGACSGAFVTAACNYTAAVGLRCEEHTVQTADGFILTLSRVRSASSDPLKPALLQHGECYPQS